MIFWDTSALAPLLIPEPHSDAALDLAEGDLEMVVWWGTPVEARSALARWARLRAVPLQSLEEVEFLLSALQEQWIEVVPTDAVRDGAEIMLRRYDLRAADALQLSAAVRWCEGQTRGIRFATFDERLGGAAYREGFTVVPA